MDKRYLRLSYLIKLSKKTARGIMYHDAWHQWGSYRKQREDKYKNKNRETIRKPK
jgi:hypothetical protein